MGRPQGAEDYSRKNACHTAENYRLENERISSISPRSTQCLEYLLCRKIKNDHDEEAVENIFLRERTRRRRGAERNLSQVKHIRTISLGLSKYSPVNDFL